MILTALYLVPQVYLRHWRRIISQEKGQLPPLTISALGAKILKESLVSYREDQILEQVALWRSVYENSAQLKFFEPIAGYSGFIRELKWLFWQIDCGEKILNTLCASGRSELGLLHQRYRDILQAEGILDGPARIKKASRLAEKKVFLKEADTIYLVGRQELTSLEKKFVRVFAGGRPLKVWTLPSAPPQLRVIPAQDPFAEVELIGQAVRLQLEQGIPIERIGLAFPNPAQYLPILLPVFKKFLLPWQAPAFSLRNTPLGKALLSLFVGELEGWHKHHFQLLTAPGWGFPFSLSDKEQRLLRLSPPLKGLAAWREYLAQEPGWNQVLDLISREGAAFTTQSVHAYAVWLQELLAGLLPEKWLPVGPAEHWAEMVKAWAGLNTVLESLEGNAWVLTPCQFTLFFESLLNDFEISPRRVFAEQLQVMKIDQLGGYRYEHLHVGGLVEGQFPLDSHAHWLTKVKREADGKELFQQISLAASQLHLYYPETDRQGRLNLAATVLPQTGTISSPPPEAISRPSLFLGDGILTDPELKEALKRRVLKDGLSVSQLNSFASCPYQFYCSFVLQLKPEEEISLDLDPKKEGIILHSVLKKFWGRYLEGPLPSLLEAQAIVEGLLSKEYEIQKGGLPAGIRRMFREFIRADLNLVKRSGFRPRYLEKRFDGLAVASKAGSVQLRGSIDRIDQNPEGMYVLYDYKTGRAPTRTELVQGQDVQVAAYLLAAQSLLPQAQNVGVAYYLTKERKRVGLFHLDYHRKLLLAKGPGCLDQTSYEKQLLLFRVMVANLLERIFAAEFPIEPVNTRMCAYCPYQGICRKEVFRR